MLYLLKLTKTTGILVNTLINFNQQISKNSFCALLNVMFPHTMFLEKTFNIIIYNIESVFYLTNIMTAGEVLTQGG